MLKSKKTTLWSKLRKCSIVLALVLIVSCASADWVWNVTRDPEYSDDYGDCWYQRIYNSSSATVPSSGNMYLAPYYNYGSACEIFWNYHVFVNGVRNDKQKRYTSTANGYSSYISSAPNPFYSSSGYYFDNVRFRGSAYRMNLNFVFDN